jgi:hypothetical protein
MNFIQKLKTISSNKRLKIIRTIPADQKISDVIQTFIPKEYGRQISLASDVFRKNGQLKCKICFESILVSYSNTGWVRCGSCKKIAHGHCYSEWLEQGYPGCPDCINHPEMIRI